MAGYYGSNTANNYQDCDDERSNFQKLPSGIVEGSCASFEDIVYNRRYLPVSVRIGLTIEDRELVRPPR